MPLIDLKKSQFAGVYTDFYGHPTSYSYIPERVYSDLYDGSEGHYGYPLMNLPNVGGSFGLRGFASLRSSVDVGSIQGGTVYKEHHYNGSVYAVVPDMAIPPKLDGSGSGALAWDKMKPDQPSVQGLNAIYELKDVPGMLRQRFHAKNLHEIGDYHLALQFGWKPLLRDIRDFVLTHMNAQKVLKQLIRDEGRPIRRSTRIFDNSTVTSVSDVQTKSGTYVGPNFVTYFYKAPIRTRIITSTIDECWASARFRYYLPGGPRDVNWQRMMIARIFGLRVTPKVVYNAIPWSWLVDWFTGVGHLISNVDTSVVDRLAADYFYVMRKSGQKKTYVSDCTFYRTNSLASVTATVSGSSESFCKTRLTGDPFGWSTPENSLSASQLSILGALGLSRLR